ncbi:MAG: hypothetical protein CSA22_09720 [Deltaproteobacteria bacterium]|nr:MAG: hypothetical protein CSA22_09720 [Deltaproteobacteria bacterium]
MNISCKHCNSKFKLPEDKVPRNHELSIRCPRCKHPMTVQPVREEPAEVSDFSIASFSFDDDDTHRENPSADFDNPPDSDAAGDAFSFIEEEGKAALLCESDPERRKEIKRILHIMEYHVTEMDNIRDALKLLRYNIYDMVVINEHFDSKNPDTNGILIFLNRMSMDARRQTFVVLLTKRFRTMDNMMTFNRSVNLIVNLKNMNQFDVILGRGLTENQIFYQTFKDKLKHAGKA